MKKTLFAVLAIAVLGAGLFAQGGAESGGSGGGDEKITLIYQNNFDPATSNDGKEHEKRYAEYMQLHPNITIEHNIITYAQSREKVVISGQSKEGPDIIHMLGEWVPDFVQMGLIEDITDEVKAWSDYSAFPQSTWDVATVDGRIYGIPSIASTRVLVYRDDLLQQAGLPVPKTWEDLRKAAKAMTKDTNGDGKIDVYGFAFCSSSEAVRGPQEFGVFLYSVDHGRLAVQKDGKWVPGFTVDQVEKVFQFYYDLMFVDQCVPPYSIGWEWGDLDPAFSTGTVAMVQDGSWMQQRIDGGDHSESWKTASFPYCTNPSTYMEVKVEGIGAFGKHKKESLDFLKWLMGRDNMVSITQTDNLPSRSDATESPLWTPNEIWKDEFLNNVQYGFSFPSVPLGPVFTESMRWVQEVLYKNATPHEAAQGFHDYVQNYLDTEVNI